MKLRRNISLNEELPLQSGTGSVRAVKCDKIVGLSLESIYYNSKVLHVLACLQTYCPIKLFF